MAVFAAGAIIVAAFSMSNAALAQNARGSATGPTTAPGFNHPDQYMHLQDVKPADNMYPVILHPDQDKAARDKLAALETARPARSPTSSSSCWMTSAGWTPASTAVASPSATTRRTWTLADEGLMLTSAYSTPSCSPTRATIHTGQNPLHHGILRPPMYGEARRSRRRDHACRCS